MKRLLIAGYWMLCCIATANALEASGETLIMGGIVEHIDKQQRLLVVRDRKFSVPFNTPVSNQDEKARAFEAIAVGDRVTVHILKRDSQRSELKASAVIRWE